MLQAEKFGDSFVLEGKISEEIKKDIHQAVSCYQGDDILHVHNSVTAQLLRDAACVQARNVKDE